MEDDGFTRLDLAFDFEDDLSDYYALSEKALKRTVFFGTTGKAETKYFGSRDSNRFIRNLRASNAQKLLVKLICDEVKETVCIFDLKNGELEVNRNKADGWSKGISHSILFLKEKDRNIGGIAIWKRALMLLHWENY